MLKKKNILILSLVAIMSVVVGNGDNALAEKDNNDPNSDVLPFEELRAFTEIFGRIKRDYVEPVSDKKLLEDAIRGMLSGLDPHSAYLVAD